MESGYLFITVRSSNSQMTIGGNKKLQKWFMRNNPGKWKKIKKEKLFK